MMTNGSPHIPAWKIGHIRAYDHPAIINPNSSGQGYAPSHVDHPWHVVTTICGYVYSHSTRVWESADRPTIHHTYRYPGTDHVVALWCNYMPEGLGVLSGTIGRVYASTHRLGSGHSWRTNGEPMQTHGLQKHLNGKARRYPELRSR